MHSKYFQGILQLRNVKEEMLDYLDNWLGKRDKDEVSIVKKVKGGMDFYFISNKSLAAIGKKMFEVFGGEMKTTATLHTRDKQKSRDLYRMTVMLRFLDFSKGDTVVVEEVVYKVKSISKNIVQLNTPKTAGKEKK